MNLKQLQKYYAVEQVPTGAARALGVTIYRANGLHECQIDLVFWTIYVSLPARSRVTPTVAT